MTDTPDTDTDTDEVLPPPFRVALDHAMPAGGLTLEQETEEAKGVRMLRVLRMFAEHEARVYGLLVDGVPMVIVKPDPAVFDGCITTADGERISVTAEALADDGGLAL